MKYMQCKKYFIPNLGLLLYSFNKRKGFKLKNYRNKKIREKFNFAIVKTTKKCYYVNNRFNKLKSEI